MQKVFSFIHSHVSDEQQQPFYGPLIQVNPGEPVLSQRKDLLEQPLDFYEPDVLPAAQPIVSMQCTTGKPSGFYLSGRESQNLK